MPQVAYFKILHGNSKNKTRPRSFWDGQKRHFYDEVYADESEVEAMRKKGYYRNTTDAVNHNGNKSNTTDSKVHAGASATQVQSGN